MFTRVRDDRIARGFQICNTRSLGRSVLIADLAAGELPRLNQAVDHPRRHDEQIGGLLCCYRFVRRHISSWLRRPLGAQFLNVFALLQLCLYLLGLFVRERLEVIVKAVYACGVDPPLAPVANRLVVAAGDNYRPSVAIGKELTSLN
ncbi:hypothetical protein MTE1_4693 [Klebsiella pneumoniae JHCK1]|nr:hypothetical protein MTE1_4693 [Klebsiella pneumoniae JHCK1]